MPISAEELEKQVNFLIPPWGIKSKSLAALRGNPITNPTPLKSPPHHHHPLDSATTNKKKIKSEIRVTGTPRRATGQGILNSNQFRLIIHNLYSRGGERGIDRVPEGDRGDILARKIDTPSPS